MKKSLGLTAKLAALAIATIAFAVTMVSISAKSPRSTHEYRSGGETWDGHSKRVEKKFQVQPDGKLVIDTDVGEISVTGTDNNEVNVVVTERGSSERLDQFSLDFSQSGNTVRIKGREDRDLFRWGNSIDIRFEVQVPKKFNFGINTSGGEIALQGVNGTVDGETSGGDITLTDYVGNAHMSTSGGNLILRECSGDLTLETSGGDIKAESVKGATDLGTSGGNISLRNIDGKLRATTSGGNIRAELTSNKGIDLETSGGNIVVLVPKSITATVDATTSGGDVSCDLDFNGKIKDGAMHGRINGGGEMIHLETSGGNIEINPTD